MNNIRDYRIPKTSHLYSFEWGKNRQSVITAGQSWPNGYSVGLETRGNPRLWVRIPAPAGSVHD